MSDWSEKHIAAEIEALALRTKKSVSEIARLVLREMSETMENEQPGQCYAHYDRAMEIVTSRFQNGIALRVVERLANKKP